MATTMVERMRARQQTGQARPQQQPPRPQGRPQGRPAEEKIPKFRLPHGAVFHATYDAAAQKWTVRLTADCASGHFDTTLVAKGIMGAFHRCGQRWYKWDRRRTAERKISGGHSST